MSQILVRGLDPHVKEALAKKARQRGVSLEAEARLALERSARSPSWADSWIEDTLHLRGSFDLPARSKPRLAKF